MRYIGDIHGKWDQYAKVIKDCDESVQVGDFGMGFINRNPHKEKRINDNLNTAMSKGNHRYIRGNHDDPAVCKQDPRCISDVSYENGTMYIGGAHSIDQAWRTIGVDWWEDEELSYNDLGLAIQTYEQVKPRIMVTHDGPDEICKQLFSYNKEYPSRTRSAFNTMFEIHKPDIWIFGHWHINTRKTILGTEFICLGELEYLDL